MEFIPKETIRPRENYPEKLSYDETRKRFLTLLGEFENPAVPLNFKITDEKELAYGVIRQRVEYDVEKNERVPAFLLFRKDIESDAPGILSIHAHGGDDIFPVGKGYHCNPDADDPTQYGYRAALAGFRVLAPDALCFGERQNAFGYAKNYYDEVNCHAELSSLGKSLAWKSVWDNSRAVEVLELLGVPSVGVIGHSGGSTQAYILAAVNEKVKAAVCMQSFMTLRHQFYQYRCCHCLYHFIPGMMQAGIDWDQVVSLIPPQKIFLGWGEQDEGTPAPMYRAFVNAIEKRCTEENLPRSLFTHEEPGGHEITENMLAGALDFLRENLCRQENF